MVNRPAAEDGLHKSIVEPATARIRQEIMSGRIRPGERIRLNMLEELLGVSHIPIREALRRLEGEGLVENIPQRGAIATPVSLTQFGQVYDLRKIIEPAVAARAMPVGRERIAEIEAALEEMSAIPEEWASPEFPALHQRFHWLILEPGANRVIEQCLRQLWQTSQRYVVLAMTFGNSANIAARHHRKLLTAVNRGDGVRLADELRAHLEHTEVKTREVLRYMHADGLVQEEPSTQTT